LTGDFRIDEEGVIASIPCHVDKSDQTPISTASGHPAKAVWPDLVPPSGCGPTTVRPDKCHHLCVGDWTTPAVLNSRDITHSCSQVAGPSGEGVQPNVQPRAQTLADTDAPLTTRQQQADQACWTSPPSCNRRVCLCPSTRGHPWPDIYEEYGQG